MELLAYIVKRKIKGEDLTLQQILGRLQKKYAKGMRYALYHKFIVWAIQEQYPRDEEVLFGAIPKAVEELIHAQNLAIKGVRHKPKHWDHVKAQARGICSWFGFKNLVTISKKCGINEDTQMKKIIELIKEAKI
jgi:hypothetical protein